MNVYICFNLIKTILSLYNFYVGFLNGFLKRPPTIRNKGRFNFNNDILRVCSTYLYIDILITPYFVFITAFDGNIGILQKFCYDYFAQIASYFGIKLHKHISFPQIINKIMLFCLIHCVINIFFCNFHILNIILGNHFIMSLLPYQFVDIMNFIVIQLVFFIKLFISHRKIKILHRHIMIYFFAGALILLPNAHKKPK